MSGVMGIMMYFILLNGMIMIMIMVFDQMFFFAKWNLFLTGK